MKLRAAIIFWGDGVSCFCHEAIGRALLQAFPNASIGESDLALQKYESAAAFHPSLEQSSWYAYLRNGPRYRFELPSGTFGYFSRYEVVFELPGDASSAELQLARQFLQSLQPGLITIEDGD